MGSELTWFLITRRPFRPTLSAVGVPLPMIRDLMGHSSITTTAIYLHTDPKHRREAVAKLRLPTTQKAEEKIIPLRGSG